MAGSARPTMSSRSAGRSTSACASVFSRPCSAWPRVAVPAARSSCRELLAAAERRAEQREGQGDRLADQVEQHLHHQAKNAELRVVERAAHRQVQVDLSAAVLEQRHRQLHRQVHRVRALHRVAEGELVEEDAVGRGELALDDLVVELGRQLAPGDAVADVLARVARQPGDLESFTEARMSRWASWRKGLSSPVIDSGALLLQLAAGDVHLGERVRGGGKAGDRAGEPGQVGVVVGADEAVAEGDVAALDLDAVDAHRRRRRARGRDRSGALAFDGDPALHPAVLELRRPGHRGGRLRSRLGLALDPADLAQVEAPLVVEDEASIESSSAMRLTPSENGSRRASIPPMASVRQRRSRSRSGG